METGRTGRRTEAQCQANGQKGRPFTSSTELSAAAGLTDTGQALVPGHRESRETDHPGVPRTEEASKDMGLPTLRLEIPGSTGMS